MLSRYLVRAYNEVRKVVSDQRGQGMVEYGLLAALIAVAAIATVQLLGGAIVGTFSTITGSL